MNFFKKLFIKKNKSDNDIFMKCHSQEEFDKRYIILLAQDEALEVGKSYFEIQDNFVGEMFDNSIRIKFIKDNNPEYFDKEKEEEYKKTAHERYLRDLEDTEDSLK